jgi:hypothetical protein
MGQKVIAGPGNPEVGSAEGSRQQIPAIVKCQSLNDEAKKTGFCAEPSSACFSKIGSRGNFVKMYKSTNYSIISVLYERKKKILFKGEIQV